MWWRRHEHVERKRRRQAQVSARPVTPSPLEHRRLFLFLCTALHCTPSLSCVLGFFLFFFFYIKADPQLIFHSIPKTISSQQVSFQGCASPGSTLGASASQRERETSGAPCPAHPITHSSRVCEISHAACAPLTSRHTKNSIYLVRKKNPLTFFFFLNFPHPTTTKN